MWRQSPTTAAAQHGVARDLVAVLTGRIPAAVYDSEDSPLLVPDDFAWQLPLGVPVRRVPWIDLYELFETALLDGERRDADLPRPGERDAAHVLAWPRSGESRVRVSKVVGTMKLWTPISHQQRDDIGGRAVRRTPYSADRILAKLYEQYGGPYVESRLGARRLTVWELDRKSKGAALCRLSTEEINEGETLKGQIKPIEQCLERCALGIPRFLVVATKTSGFDGVEQRLDHRWLEPHIRAGTVRWIVAREPDRVGRDKVAVYTFYNLLKEKRVALYYNHPFGRQIKWSRDELQLDILHAFATNEGRTITRRTLTAHIRRWVLEGKGWGGSGPIGTTRDTENWLVPHERGMEFMNWCFSEFVRQGIDGTPGCRQLADAAKKRWGVTLHPERYRQLLQKRFYVDGHWHVNLLRWRVACRPVEWGPLAVPEATFAKAQLLLRTNRSQRKQTELGASLLNYRPFLHADCMDVKVPKHTAKGVRYDTPKLMAYSSRHGVRGGHGEVRYYHTPHPGELGCDACKGLAIPRSVDAVVVKTLLSLARDRELQRLFAQQAARTEPVRDERPARQRLDDTRRELKRREGKLVEIEANPAGEPGPYRDFNEKSWAVLHDVWERRIQETRDDLDELESLVRPRRGGGDVQRGRGRRLACGDGTSAHDQEPGRPGDADRQGGAVQGPRGSCGPAYGARWFLHRDLGAGHPQRAAAQWAGEPDPSRDGRVACAHGLGSSGRTDR